MVLAKNRARSPMRMISAKGDVMKNEARKKRPKRLPAEIKAMVDGGAMLLGIMNSIIAKATEFGATSEDIRCLSQPAGAGAREQIAKSIVGCAEEIVKQEDDYDILYKKLLLKEDEEGFRQKMRNFPLLLINENQDKWKVSILRNMHKAYVKSYLEELEEMERDGKILIPTGIQLALEYVATYLNELNSDEVLALPFVIKMVLPFMGYVDAIPVFEYVSGSRKVDFIGVERDLDPDEDEGVYAKKKFIWLVLTKK